MEKFSLTSNIFKTDGEQPVPVGVLYFDGDQVREILDADIDDDTDMFSLVHDGETNTWELRYDGGDLPGQNAAFDLHLYIEYIAINGQRTNALPKFRIFGSTDAQCLPTIHHIENLATKVGSTERVVLHCHNLTAENIDGLGVFLIANGGDICIRIPPEEISYDFGGDGSEECSTADQTASFTLMPTVFGGDDEGCGTYEIHFGYGDKCSAKTLLENSGDTRNLALVRYKFDAESEPTTSNSEYSGDGNCWFRSPISLVTPTVGSDTVDVPTGAGEGLGKDIYVKGISYDCPCDAIKYYYVRLVYNNRLDSRRGEMVLDGVSLREGDIVWLAAQFDGTDGLWEVRKDDWQGLGTPDYTEGGTSPCFAVNPPLPVDCGVFIDPGIRVTETVKAVCADDVTDRNGPQTICGVSVVPGDIVVLENQSDGYNGLWRVLCGEWEYLGSEYERSGNTVDLGRSVIVQNDIDFCKCGGIFHIDYYYLNTACYLNHARRTVKVMCGGSSIVPNGKRQVVITDYQIADGANKDLVAAMSGTPGDPVLDDCVLVDENFERKFSMETREHRTGCSYDAGDTSPDCRPYCDCERHYTVKMTDDYTTSSDSNGFSVVFWQRRDDGWHLYAYVASGNYRTGIEYYVMHAKSAGVITADEVDFNRELTMFERDEFGNDVEKRTHDAWFVPHVEFQEIQDGDDEATRARKNRHNAKMSYLVEHVLADGFGLVDPNWSFAARDGYGEKIPMEYIQDLGPDNLYDMWRITDDTQFLCNRSSDGVIGMRGVWGFRYYRTVMSAADFAKLYNGYACR